jgi:hypothetical protein
MRSPTGGGGPSGAAAGGAQEVTIAQTALAATKSRIGIITLSRVGGNGLDKLCCPCTVYNYALDQSLSNNLNPPR